MPERDSVTRSPAGSALPAIPSHRTRFIGRNAELVQLRQLLATGPRLITLSGPGGCGKARLAIQLARAEAAELPGAVTWIELAGRP